MENIRKLESLLVRPIFSRRESHTAEELDDNVLVEAVAE